MGSIEKFGDVKKLASKPAQRHVFRLLALEQGFGQGALGLANDEKALVAWVT